jgi:radical SAM protein with 4Fe4S-binding SPASM domain
VDFLLPSFIHLLKNPPRPGVLLNCVKYKLNQKKNILNHAPVSLVFYVTKRCNYKCEFCFTYSDLNKPDWEAYELNEEKLSELLKTDFGKKALRIGFLGGEPFLNSQLEAMLGIAHKKGKITTVVTNASLVTDERLAKFLTNYPTMLGISLYDNNIEDVKRLSKALVGKNKFFWVQSVIEATDLESIIKKIEFAKENKISNLILSNYHPGYSGQKNKVIYEDDQRFKEISLLARDLAKKYKINLTLPNPIDLSYKNRSCKMPVSYLHVDSKGDIGPCCMRAPDKKYGNLNNNNDWNKEYFKNLRSTFQNKELEPITDCLYCENFSRDLYDV